MQLDLILLKKKYNEHQSKYGVFRGSVYRDNLITHKGAEYRAIYYPKVLHTKIFRDSKTGEKVVCKYIG